MIAGIPCGGWCPKGRLAEDGIIPVQYALLETGSADYAERTLANVRDSDATLILTWGPPTGGTAYTVDCANRLGRVCLVVDSPDSSRINDVVQWLEETRASILNLAGPRESTFPGAYALAYAFLSTLFAVAARVR